MDRRENPPIHPSVHPGVQGLDEIRNPCWGGLRVSSQLDVVRTLLKGGWGWCPGVILIRCLKPPRCPNLNSLRGSLLLPSYSLWPHPFWRKFLLKLFYLSHSVLRNSSWPEVPDRACANKSEITVLRVNEGSVCATQANPSLAVSVRKSAGPVRAPAQSRSLTVTGGSGQTRGHPTSPNPQI